MSKDALAVARRQIESLQDGELQAAQHGTESVSNLALPFHP
jgi:hypothetical protein